MSDGFVLGVHRDSAHRFAKTPVDAIEIISGLGVKDDAHAGAKVQHLSRVRQNPEQPNLRQVHLIHAELFDELHTKGFAIDPGDLGENITTRGIDLCALGRGTVLRIGSDAVLKVTGLRNPCAQIESFAPGLLKEVAIRRGNKIERKAGIMCIAVRSGEVRPADAIIVERANGPHIPLERV